MKKAVVTFGIIIVVLVHLCMFYSCKSRQATVLPGKTVEVEKTVTKTIRDTTFVVEADSSFYRAWIECVNNKPVLRNPVSQTGQNFLKAPAVSLSENGDLSVESATEILELHARIEELVTELNTKTVEYITVEVEKPLTMWQQLFIWLGRLTSLVLLVLAGYGLVKLYLRKYVKK